MRATSPTLIRSHFPLLTRTGAERSCSQNGQSMSFLREEAPIPVVYQDNDIEAPEAWNRLCTAAVCVSFRMFHTTWVLSQVRPEVLHFSILLSYLNYLLAKALGKQTKKINAWAWPSEK